jgi:hypothetical protein
VGEPAAGITSEIIGEDHLVHLVDDEEALRAAEEAVNRKVDGDGDWRYW